MRIQCAQCHNHPFERWTMDDYYGFAAFFAQVGFKRDEDTRAQVVYHRGNGSMRHKRDGSTVAPRHLTGETPKIPNRGDPRIALADWLLADENPFFAANVANRVFARFFGSGLVEPVDDVRVSNPPSHPALHQELARRLKSYDYDIKPLVRDICQSKAYQLAARTEDSADFAAASARRLSAEQLLDAIGQVTGRPTKLNYVPTGEPSTQARGGRINTFLDTFGRPDRKSVAACERRSDPTLGQALHLINGQTIQSKIRAKDGRLARQLSEKRTDREIIEELFLAAYARMPRKEEVHELKKEIAAAKNRRRALEDLYWAVLNSREFLFNH